MTNFLLLLGFNITFQMVLSIFGVEMMENPWLWAAISFPVSIVVLYLLDYFLPDEPRKET